MLPVVPDIMRDRSDELTTLLDLLPTSLRTAGTGAGTIGRAAILAASRKPLQLIRTLFGLGMSLPTLEM